MQIRMRNVQSIDNIFYYDLRSNYWLFIVNDLRQITKLLSLNELFFSVVQEIDALLSGVLTEEDEDAVVEELETIIKDMLPEAPAAVPAGAGEPQLPEVPHEEPGSFYVVTRASWKGIVNALKGLCYVS